MNNKWKIVATTIALASMLVVSSQTQCIAQENEEVSENQRIELKNIEEGEDAKLSFDKVKGFFTKNEEKSDIEEQDSCTDEECYTGDEEEQEVILKEAKYDVYFKQIWSEDTHPSNFPKDGELTGYVGCAHNGKAPIWKEGGVVSKGVYKLMDKHSYKQIEKTIKKATKQGVALGKFKMEECIDKEYDTFAEINVNEECAYVSLIARMEPSPDWFVGIDNTLLYENDAWIEEKTVVMYAFDAGMFDGETYECEKDPTEPQNKITLIKKDPFLYEEEVIPVGQMVFKKQVDITE